MYMSILDNKFKEINDYKHNAESESKFIRSHNASKTIMDQSNWQQTSHITDGVRKLLYPITFKWFLARIVRYS